jgi:hypothetical protein
VALFMEDPGYWEYFPSWKSRNVLAEGDVVVAQTQSYSDFQQRYFQHQNTEDLPGDDVFDRFVMHAVQTPHSYQKGLPNSSVENGTASCPKPQLTRSRKATQ